MSLPYLMGRMFVNGSSIKWSLFSRCCLSSFYSSSFCNSSSFSLTTIIFFHAHIFVIPSTTHHLHGHRRRPTIAQLIGGPKLSPSNSNRWTLLEDEAKDELRSKLRVNSSVNPSKSENSNRQKVNEISIKGASYRVTGSRVTQT